MRRQTDTVLLDVHVEARRFILCLLACYACGFLTLLSIFGRIGASSFIFGLLAFGLFVGLIYQGRRVSLAFTRGIKDD